MRRFPARVTAARELPGGGEFGMEYLAAALTMALPAMTSALAQAWTATHAMDGMARQPEAAADIRGSLVLPLAFMEALTLFSFVIALLLWIKI
ncbi:MAG: ATP synthase F0 subunit C [Bacteroidota bacterium]